MIESITFKTELGEIITLEEVVILFDSIKSKSEFELISLSLFPKFNQIREEAIQIARNQRNAELSRLLLEIANRKQEIKINMWKALSVIGSNKKIIQNNPERAEDLEQIMYEEEQIISIYESSIKILERKEQRIMNGKYTRMQGIKTGGRKRILRKQLVELKEKLCQISEKHNDCFALLLTNIEELIENSIISEKTKFPKNLSKIATEGYTDKTSIIINNVEHSADTNEETKDFYVYEPNQNNPDDDLIYQLLKQAYYGNQNGTINGLKLNTEVEEI